MLRERGFQLAWFRILPDDPQYLTAELQRTMGEDIPVFSCGGIGATPDDYTRACAAAAADVPLVRHPEAAEIIEARFGEAAHPYRIRMADLPEGAELIPNPVNRMPGFSIREHHFLPGFPDMAHPMAEWVLDHRYGRGDRQVQRSVWVQGVTETDLMPLMEDLERRFPKQKLFSLPRLGEPRRGLRVGIYLLTMRGEYVFTSFDTDDPAAYERWSERPAGHYVSRARIPGRLLNEGRYVLAVNASTFGHRTYFHEENALSFLVDATGAVGFQWPERRLGIIRPLLAWDIERVAERPRSSLPERS